MKQRDNTILIIQDQHDHIFGAYCCEYWHINKDYYGRGESFVFTFENDEDIKTFFWTEKDERY